MWIYEHKDWPNFNWDEKLIGTKLANIRYKQGQLIGKMKSLGFDLEAEANFNILTADVIKTSAIEGEKLNEDEVRSSIARRLGIKQDNYITASRDVEGIVEITLDATQNFSKKLTAERLFNWHAALFPTGRSGMHKIIVGDLRKEASGDMQVVSGAIGNEKVHFQAPHASKLEEEVKQFLKWFNNTRLNIDPVIKAGIAHLWFVTIHPFEDGNGRISRAISDMALSRADGTSSRFYSISSQIESQRKDYYNQLEKQQRSNTNITKWINWFLECLDGAISASEVTLSNVLYKAQLWSKINCKPINQRQSLIINRMTEDSFEGYMNTSKYAKIAKCSNDTALRDILELLERDIFIKNSAGGRSTSYRLPKNDEL